MEEELKGEVLQKDSGAFFIWYNGKQYGFFSSREGAEDFLRTLRKGEEDNGS